MFKEKGKDVLTDWIFGGKQLILRMACSAMLAFFVVVFFSPWLIRFLIRKKLGDKPEFYHTLLNAMTKHKSATPTMGGIVIVLAIVLSTFLFADIKSMYIRMALMVTIGLGLLGVVDDILKIRAAAKFASTDGQKHPSREGLRMVEKLLFQIALAVLLAIFIYAHGAASGYRNAQGQIVNAAHSFYLPFVSEPIALTPWVYVVIAVVVMVGSSNAVNLADGMDGLAAGCLVFATIVFLIISWVVGNYTWAEFLHLPFVPQSAELAVVCAAMIGSCVGFLWYNSLPAQVFMGDTGSLPLGGLIGYIAVVTRHELTLLIAGGVFVMEAVSVLMQVLHYKATGRRIWLCTPIHHHFHLLGWAESKVVVRFWLISALCAAAALASLKLR